MTYIYLHIKNGVALLFFSLFTVVLSTASDGIQTKAETTESESLDLRSDTLDIINYSIYLDFTEMNSGIMKGTCTIDFVSKMNAVSEINLDFIQTEVDSVLSNGNPLNYSYSNGTIHIALPSSLNVGDSSQISVYYKGAQLVTQSFGGMYFQSGYAYNLGVSLPSSPPNFGKAWFPCFDNFVERSTYDIHVLTNNGRSAYCSGLRTSVESVGVDSSLTSWRMEEEIPTYLASVAVTNYTHVENYFESISGEMIPVWLAARPTDTTAMKQSFANLQACFDGFEERLGWYRWSRIGFVVVPFSGGAMEHATNIAYPKFAVNGNTAYETLYAHEFAHHWFGDLVTCRTADDMWLNEGWASYCEALFLEDLYGEEAYKSHIRDVHKEALLQSHRADNGRYPVSGVPASATYGSHIYTKGADMAHTLRGYMGDAAFFTAIKSYMNEFQFSDVSSYDMRDWFQQFTNANLSDYFNDWIFQKGFPEFRIKSAENTSGNNWQITVEQNRHYNPELYNNVPMQLTILDQNGSRHYFDLLLSGELTEASIQLENGITAQAFFLNENEAISQAVLAENKNISNGNMTLFNYAEAGISIADFAGADSLLVRVENHFAEANPGQTQAEFYISPDRWWNIYHNGSEQSKVNCKLNYFGNSTNSKYYDPLFFEYLENHDFDESDMILVYRPDGTSLWQEVEDYLILTSSDVSNWLGEILIMNVQSGQYAWAVRTGETQVKNEYSNFSAVKMFYNGMNLVIQPEHHIGLLRIHDISGKLILEKTISRPTEIPVSHFSKGTYIAQWMGENGSRQSYSFVK